MQRTLQVNVDHTTWPTTPDSPDFPPSFPTSPETFDVDIPMLLLTIGYLTTPAHSSGVTLSEFWAWVRYLHAISEDSDLRVSGLFGDIDSHQKTILSDDFGMGVPLLWLADRLQLGPICDGRYFIDWVAASVGASAVKTAKRGPGKSPDFVAWGASDKWHIIECKGTQSSLAYRDRQLGTPDRPTTGAVAQKRTITFPVGHIGQRLACGTFIGVHGGKEQSQLKIIDPVGKQRFDVPENGLVHAEDAAIRSTLARALRLAGFEATSVATSAPYGKGVSDRPTRGFAEQRRLEIVEEKTSRALNELKDRKQRNIFTVKSERYRGRRVEFDLPAIIRVKDREIRSVQIRQGVNESLLGELVRRPLVEGLLSDEDTPWREIIGMTNAHAGPYRARLQVGSLFVSEIRLKS